MCVVNYLKFGDLKMNTPHRVALNRVPRATGPCAKHMRRVLHNPDHMKSTQESLRLKVRLSSKKHIPVIELEDGEHYLWDLKRILTILLMYPRYSKYYGASHFSRGKKVSVLQELSLWENHYLPRFSLDKDAAILDVGAGEGETVVFFASYGFSSFIAVEPDPGAFRYLLNNTSHLNVEAHNRGFLIQDLERVDYAKIDCEGCEAQLLTLGTLPCEIVVEVHGKQLLDQFMKKWPNLSIEWKLSGMEVYGVRLFP